MQSQSIKAQSRAICCGNASRLQPCADIHLLHQHTVMLICWGCHVDCQGLAADAESGIPAAAALLETDVAVLPF